MLTASEVPLREGRPSACFLQGKQSPALPPPWTAFLILPRMALSAMQSALARLASAAKEHGPTQFGILRENPLPGKARRLWCGIVRNRDRDKGLAGTENWGNQQD